MLKLNVLIFSFLSINLLAFSYDDYPEWADTIENPYIPIICGSFSCISNVQTRDPYEAKFYKQLQSINNLWIIESANLLAKKTQDVNNDTRDYVSNNFEIDISSAETLAAIYDLKKIKEDTFIMDNKEEYNLSLNRSSAAICQRVRCPGDILRVNIMFEYNLPK